MSLARPSRAAPARLKWRVKYGCIEGFNQPTSGAPLYIRSCKATITDNVRYASEVRDFKDSSILT